MSIRRRITRTGDSAPTAVGATAATAIHIEVGHDWTRCDGREGCGALLPITQASCPLCGRVNRQDIMSLRQRRLVPGHDAYDHAVAVLLPRAGVPPEKHGLEARSLPRHRPTRSQPRNQQSTPDGGAHDTETPDPPADGRRHTADHTMLDVPDRDADADGAAPNPNTRLVAVMTA